jgi:branched-chain amino acid transport system permease protein
LWKDDRVDILISGIQLGAIYAILSIGFSLILGSARIVFLTYAVFYMLVGYFWYIINTLFGMNLILSASLAVVMTVALGIATYKLCVERIRQHETTVILITLVLAFFFEECVLLGFGSQHRNVPAFIPGFVELHGVKVLNQYSLTLAVSLVLIFLIWLFLWKTKLGIAIRATSQDREVVNLMGINEKRMSVIAMGVGIALAGIAGVMVAPIYLLEPTMWTEPFVMVLAIVILGGLGSIKGSIIGAYILGYAQVALVYFVPMGSFIRSSVALAAMIVVLLIRPEGMFGVLFEEERL